MKFVLVCAVFLGLIIINFGDGFCVENNHRIHDADILQSDQYLLANVQFTILHELGHLLLANMDFPLWGHEEIAADQFATIMFLRSQDGGGTGVPQGVAAVVYELNFESFQDPIVYRDSHPPLRQRFYDFLCLVYGGNSKTSHVYPELGWIPIDRAMYCDQEFDQIVQSVEWVTSYYGSVCYNCDASQNPFDSQKLNIEGEGRILIDYKEARSSSAKYLSSMLKKSQIVERTSSNVARNFRIPRDITIVFRECGDNAYCNIRSGEIVVCYNLLEEYVKNYNILIANRMYPGSEKSIDVNISLPPSIVRRLQDLSVKKGETINEISLRAIVKYLDFPKGAVKD